MLNLDAPILPGISAAGFELGQHLSQVMARLGDLRQWTGTPPLMEAIQSTTGWILVPRSLITNGMQLGCSLHSASGIVELQFDSLERLFDISVFPGYNGTLFGVIKVGSSLKSVQTHIKTAYDFGDELHYPVPDEKTKGIAFYASEDALEKSPEQIITGISVFRREV